MPAADELESHLESFRFPVRLAAPLPLENYLHHRRTGAFLVIDPQDGNTLAAGLVKDHPGDHEDERYSI